MSDGKLLKSAVIERADRLDAGLIRLLIGSESLRGHFFTEVDGIWAFDKVKFGDFVSNKAFLPDSYTAFRNRIGLADARGRYLGDGNDVVLAWPYKDCVLEGGMTKEDQGRDELFWNLTLAPDDITRLFEPKALTGFERWDEAAVEAGRPRPAGKIEDSDNLLVKGNNLLALHSLKRRFSGSVKLVYIDPPFNTGTDSFRYNDRFNHSAWLTFFRNRVEAAIGLLAADGVIAVQLDDGELAYAKILMDELFGRQNYVNSITIKTNSPFGFKGTSEGLFKQAGFLLVYAKDKSKLAVTKAYVRRDYDSQYRLVFDDIGLPEESWTWKPIGEAAAAELGFTDAADAAKRLGRGEFEKRIAEYAVVNADRVFRTASVTGGALKKRSATIARSKAKRDRVIRHPGDDMDYRFVAGERVLFYGERLVEVDGEIFPGEVVTDIWTDIPIEGIANEGGVNFPKGKKPEALLRRLVELFTGPGDLVLDYFAGSGTTAAVAHKLGRRWIAVEQLDYMRTLTMQRVKNVIAGDGSGISAAIEWAGGGSFVYLELREWNEAFGRRVRSAADEAGLAAAVADLKANGYWRHDCEGALFDWDAFEALPVEKRKAILLESLDCNHLYVNYGDIADEAYGVPDREIAANKAFYEDAA